MKVILWNKNFFPIIRNAILLIIGILLLVNAVFLLFISNFNIGLILTFLLGIAFVLYSIFWDSFMGKIPKWLTYTFFMGVLLVILFVIFLLLYGSVDKATYREDGVIVLGAGIRGEALTESLINRLDCAIEYYEKNPNAIIVVSGGQGPQEHITEALAMERYLLGNGIPKDSIIKEERATSTYENFMYSKALLDDYFDGGYTVTFVTNDYHIYRAGAIAQRVGFENPTHLSSATPWYALVPSCLRECIGVIKFWLLQK